MSIIIILGAATLLTAPLEAYNAHRIRSRVKPYRKPDQKRRHKKSPSTFHSDGQ